MVSGGMSFVKYLLFIFNLLFVISGIAIIVIGVLAVYPYKNYSVFMDSKFSAGPIILIVVGSIIFFIAFFGCCGAIKENNCMVVTFSVLLFTIFCIQLAAGISGYIYRNDVKRGVERELKKSMDEYKVDGEIQNVWDVMQSDLECCGIDRPGDWSDRGLDIPKSCCKNTKGADKCKAIDLYTQGCSTVLKEYIERYALIIGGVGIGIAFVQLVGVILACCLARSIRKEYESV